MCAAHSDAMNGKHMSGSGRIELVTGLDFIHAVGQKYVTRCQDKEYIWEFMGF